VASSETARLIAELSLNDKLTPGVNKALGSVGRLETGLSKVGRGAGQLGAGLSRAGGRIAIGIGAAVAGAAKAAIDFEDAFSGVRKTVDASDAELDDLAISFRKMAAEIPIAATEFARLGETAGALGIATEGIDEFVRTTALLGVTTDLTADQSADALGRIGNILNLTSDEFDNFGSALVNLGNKGASTESEIIEITKRFSAAGKQAGFTTTDILALAEATASFTGLAPEAGGTALSRLSSILTKVTATGGSKFKLLNKIVGKDFRKALDKDASGALLSFLKGLGKLDKYERANALKELGLDSAYLRQLLGGLTENIDGVETSLQNAEEGWQGNFLNEEAAKKFDNVKSKLILLKQGLIEAGIVVGEGFTPAIGRAADKLSEFLKQDANRSALKDLGKDIGAAIDDIDWQEVIDGARSLVDVMKVALDYAKRLFDAFNLLPTPIKGAAAGFLALDKLSGGLVGSGLGGILSGLGSTFARTLATSIPVFGKAFVQPVFVTNMGVGGLGGGVPGKGGGIPGAVGALGVAGLIVAAAVPIGEAFAAALPKELKGEDGAGKSESQTRIENALAEIADKMPKEPWRPPEILDPRDAHKSWKDTTTIEKGLDSVKGEERTSREVLQQAIDASKAETTRETARGTGIVQSAVDRSASTIRNGFSLIPPPIVNVRVGVTATSVTKNVTIQNRYGDKGSSRNADSNGSGTLGNGGR
jgi:TP901 family phage tail tape measure protein